MSRLEIRWSELEAKKPYARPFAVLVQGDQAAQPVMVAMNGTDLLFYRQFQKAVLTLAGALFSDADIDAAEDPQRAWLNALEAAMPQLATFRIRPISEFDPAQGRQFNFELRGEPGNIIAMLSADALLEYQNFQAELAHQSGLLYRAPEIEDIGDPAERQRKWVWFLNGLMDTQTVER